MRDRTQPLHARRRVVAMAPATPFAMNCRSLAQARVPVQWLAAVALTVATSGQSATAEATPRYSLTEIELGSLARASALNNSEWVTGTITLSETEGRAYLYSDGEVQDLGTLGGETSVAVDINESGEILGSSTYGGDLTGSVFLYKDGVMQDLGILIGMPATATGLNNNGQVTGGASVTARRRACLHLRRRRLYRPRHARGP